MENIAPIFGDHVEEISRFGNHNRKYLFAADRHLCSFLNSRRLRTPTHKITVGTFPKDVEMEMAYLARSLEGKEALRVLGGYYGYHYLLMNAEWVRQLRLLVGEGGDLWGIYSFMVLDVVKRFRVLLSSFIRFSLETQARIRACPFQGAQKLNNVF